MVAVGREGGHDRVLVEALVLLDTVRRERGQRRAALGSFDEAASLAGRPGYATQVFETCFQACPCVEGRDGKKAARYLQRCEPFHPLLTGRFPSIQQYEAAARGAA